MVRWTAQSSGRSSASSWFCTGRISIRSCAFRRYFWSYWDSSWCHSLLFHRLTVLPTIAGRSSLFSCTGVGFEMFSGITLLSSFGWYHDIIPTCCTWMQSWVVFYCRRWWVWRAKAILSAKCRFSSDVKSVNKMPCGEQGISHGNMIGLRENYKIMWQLGMYVIRILSVLDTPYQYQYLSVLL